MWESMLIGFIVSFVFLGSGILIITIQYCNTWNYKQRGKLYKPKFKIKFCLSEHNWPYKVYQKIPPMPWSLDWILNSQWHEIENFNSKTAALESCKRSIDEYHRSISLQKEESDLYIQYDDVYKG